MILVNALIMASLGVASAAEEPAPGWRLHAAPSLDRASARLVAVPGTASVFSEALRLRMGTERWSGELEQVLVQAAAPSLDWTHVAVGRTRLASRVHLGERRNHAWLLEGEVGLDEALAWGSHSTETTRGFAVRTGWEGSWTPGRSTLLARATLGLGVQQPFATLGIPLAADTAFAWIAPLWEAGRLDSVLEIETQLVDAIPVAGRWLLRWSTEDALWSVDLGGQLSTDYDSEDGTGGVIAQVGRRL